MCVCTSFGFQLYFNCFGYCVVSLRTIALENKSILINDNVCFIDKQIVPLSFHQAWFESQVRALFESQVRALKSGC